MPTYFGMYKINANLPPPQDPKEQLKQLEGFKAAINHEIQSGVIKESNEFLEADGGYFITKDVSPEQLHAALTGWFPYVTFEIHQTIPSQKAIENAISAIKMRVGMM